MSVIEIQNLKKYFGDTKAVDDISFQIEKGEIFGFLGPNGAGKTTTINMLTTQLRPTSGTASVVGFDIVSKPGEVRQNIGIIFQDPSLDLELTAWENLKFHGMLYNISEDDIKKRADKLLSMVELVDRKHSIVKTFSGGMKRRLEIARGLLHEPRILFLDEPTLGLDPQTRNRLWEYIFDVQKDKEITIFLTTHSMEEAENCSRIAIIDYGKIVAIGTPGELKKETGSRDMNGAFLAITGREFRDKEGYDPRTKMRNRPRFKH